MGILHSLGINGTLLAQILNFVLLFVFLRIVAWPPLVKAMEARRQRIEEQITAAEAERKEAERARLQREEALATARADAQAIIDRAERVAADQSKALLDEARAQAERIRTDAEEGIAREREAALAALRGEVADLALLAAGKVLGQRVGEPEDRRLVEEFITEVGRQA